MASGSTSNAVPTFGIKLSSALERIVRAAGRRRLLWRSINRLPSCLHSWWRDGTMGRTRIEFFNCTFARCRFERVRQGIVNRSTLVDVETIDAVRSEHFAQPDR